MLITVDGQDFSQQFSTITLPSTVTEVDVKVKQLAGDHLSFSLVRFGRTDVTEDYETTWKLTRFINQATPGMTVRLDLPHPGRYVLSCHSYSPSSTSAKPEVLYVEVINPPPSGSATIRGLLNITRSCFGQNLIWAKGQVINADDTVTCTLTPIDCVTGESTGSGPPASQTPALIQTPGQPGATWTACFPGPFSGCYLLEATAPNEGSVSVTGDAQKNCPIP
jgi:hypothetical protein